MLLLILLLLFLVLLLAIFLASITVKAQDRTITLEQGSSYSFRKGETFTFILDPPNPRPIDGIIVEITVPGAEKSFYNLSDLGALKEEDGHGTFTFTPAEAKEFCVWVWWSEYDRIGPKDGQYMIETRIGPRSGQYTSETQNSAGGQILFSSDPLEDSSQMTPTYGLKSFYAQDASVTLSFIPDAGKTLNDVTIDEVHYCLQPREGDKDLSELFDPSTGTYRYTIERPEEADRHFFHVVFQNAD